MRTLCFMLVLLVAANADAQLFRRWTWQVEQPETTFTSAQTSVSSARLPGPSHGTGTGCNCGMCIGIHLRSVHGVDLNGVSDWYTYHDNIHNQGLLIYHPTPQTLVARMVELLAPKPGDLFLDLGSGDGRILIAAARFGCDRVVGYELKPELVAKSKKAAKAAGVHVTVNQESFLSLSLRTVSCVTVYLDEPMLRQTVPLLESLRPGARVVSYAHQLPGVKVQDVYAWDAGVLYYYDAPIRMGD